MIWTSQTGITSAEALARGIENVCKMRRIDGTVSPAILLDFGTELYGGIRIDSPTNTKGQPVRFRVRFGESVSEAMGEPNNDHGIHDQEVLASWMGYTEVGITGFRLVRLDLLDTDVQITLSSVTAVSLYHDIPYAGSFECSDDRLNEIWSVGARTVHLCMQDHLWDGIKRDRLVWIGDIHPETRVISSVFGQVDVVEKSLDYARDKYPLPEWMNGFSSYSLWWIIAHRDWYRYHGDLAYLRLQKDYLLGLLDKIMQCVDSSGSEQLDAIRFLDWSTAADPDALSTGLQALTVLTLTAGAELCRVLGEDDLAGRVSDLAGIAASSRLVASKRKHPMALMVLAGMASPEDVNDSILSVDPCRDVSTFYGYYVLQARAEAGDYLGCLRMIRDYWGKMIDLGATTFWEHFEIDWAENAGRIDEIVPIGMRDIHKDCGDHCYKGFRHSLCHGWAAGPTAWLSEHVLGVTPASPGFSTAKIVPHLADLLWARGTVPTPMGPIEVSHEIYRGDVRTEVVLPDGVKLVEAASQQRTGELTR